MPPGVLLISHCAVVLLTGLNARKTQKYAIGGVQVHGLPLARLQCTFSDPVRTGYRRVAINRYCIIEATSLSTPYCCFYSCLYVVYPYLVCCSTVMCSNSSTSTHRSALENRKKILRISGREVRNNFAINFEMVLFILLIFSIGRKEILI